MKEVEQLNQIRLSIDTKTITPDALSRAVVKINSLLCTIGEKVAELKKEYELYYWERKRMFIYYKATAEGTADQREKQANEAIDKIKQQEIEADFKYQTLKNTRDDYSSYGMALQSRLNVLRDERIKTYKD